MPVLNHSHRVNFNQCWRYDDIKTGFNCFGYIILFFNYVLAQRILHPNQHIDYSYLKKTLIESKDKRALQESQDDFVMHYYSEVFHKRICTTDAKSLFDNELLLLNKTKETKRSDDLELLMNDILQDLHKQNFGNFYSLTLESTQTFLKMPLNHIVCMYLASSNELHFFDANSGLYIIHLDNDTNTLDLKETLVNLIFKQNIIMKYAFDASLKNIEYSLTKSKVNNSETKLNEIINNFLIDSEVASNVSTNPSLDQFDKIFLRRLFYFIEVQRDMLNRSKEGTNTNFFSSFFKLNDSKQITTQHLPAANYSFTSSRGTG